MSDAVTGAAPAPAFAPAPSTIGTAAPGARPDPPVVDGAHELSPAWFDVVLGTGGTRSAIRGVTADPVGTGQMATTLRVHLALGDGTERTVVVKHGRPDVASALAGMAYAKEVSFYAELSDRVTVRTPDCLYAAMEAQDDGAARFVLVLEDLSDARQGDQIAGCPVEHAHAAVVNLAGLHGPTWCDADLAAPRWLGGDDAIDGTFMRSVIEAAADAFADRFAAELTPDEATVLTASRELLAEWMFDRGDRFAVVHGDYRLDNLLFPVDDPARVAAVDWQTTAVGPPGRDLAYFVGTCLDVAARRRHERDLVAAYHRALLDHDVTGYELADCLADYREGMLHAPLIILLGRLTAGVTERGDEMFRVMWRRSAAAIHDLGTLEAVRARLAGRG
jgi:Ecdysteroid kinase-like family